MSQDRVVEAIEARLRKALQARLRNEVAVHAHMDDDLHSCVMEDLIDQVEVGIGTTNGDTAPITLPLYVVAFLVSEHLEMERLRSTPVEAQVHA